MATTVAGNNSYFEGDGKAVNVDLIATVAKGAVIVADGWVGLAGGAGESGDAIALVADNREYQFLVPASLAVAKGAIVYIAVATSVTGHYPDDEGYTTTAGAGKVAFFKATAAKDGNNIVTGIMLAHGALAS
jgi:hypothetical protein